MKIGEVEIRRVDLPEGAGRKGFGPAEAALATAVLLAAAYYFLKKKLF